MVELQKTMCLVFIMITKFLLVGGVLSTGFGYYYLRKGKRLNEVFKSVKNVPLFNMDYLDKLVDLPLDRDILLLGTVKPHDYVIQDSEGKDCVLKTIAREMPEDQSPDHFWQTNQDFRCFITNSAGQGIYIQNKNPDVMLAFNLKTVGKIDKSKLKLPLLLSLSSLITRSHFQQKSIRIDSNLVAIGRLLKSSNQPVHYMMRPQFIMGDSKEALLKYLDLEIVRVVRWSKIFVGVGMAMLLSHFVYTRVNRERPVLPEPE